MKLKFQLVKKNVTVSEKAVKVRKEKQLVGQMPVIQEHLPALLSLHISTDNSSRMNLVSNFTKPSKVIEEYRTEASLAESLEEHLNLN